MIHFQNQPVSKQPSNTKMSATQSVLFELKLDVIVAERHPEYILGALLFARHLYL